MNRRPSWKASEPNVDAALAQFSRPLEALADGDEVASWETVLTIAGVVPEFVQLETLYLGALARRTKIATKSRRVVEAAGDKPVLYFPARFDHWAVQEGDGHAGCHVDSSDRRPTLDQG